MNQEQQHLRSSAEKEFLDSLDQLQDTLLSREIERPKSKTTRPPDRMGDRRHQKAAPPPIDAGALEAAVADIEEFIKSRDSDSGNEHC